MQFSKFSSSVPFQVNSTQVENAAEGVKAPFLRQL